jgi:DNA anti-recombination protein RmuC
MSKDINDILKEVHKNHQEIFKTNKDVNALEDKLVKELLDIKKFLKMMDRKISDISNKIQEFEIIMDAAEIIEEHMEEEENKYSTEWNPYDDEGYESEEYENYDEDDESDN